MKYTSVITLATILLAITFVTAKKCDKGCVAACYMIGGDYE